jgi:hypothetical protein
MITVVTEELGSAGNSFPNDETLSAFHNVVISQVSLIMLLAFQVTIPLS